MNEKIAPPKMKNGVKHAFNDIAWTNEQKADLDWLWRHMVGTKISTKN